MVLYAGRPVDVSETPAQLGDGIGPDIYRCGNSLYRLTDEKMSIYNLEKKTFHPLEPEPDMFRCSPREQENERTKTQQERASPAPCAPLAYWVECCNGGVDTNSVRAGIDLDGGELYVGRAYLLGCLLPGKVAVAHRVCYVAFEGKEYAVPIYEVLVVKRGQAKWVSCKDGYTPPNALPCGKTVRGETIYSARALTNDIVTPGHFVHGENVSRISYDMKEFLCPEYEILTIEKD